MRTANIPLSAFEENRRNVDRDPAAWVSRYGTKPEDCEDYYLLGRAYFNLGDFEKARTAFEKSRELLPSEEETSRKTIAADIATALVAITGTTSQTMMKKEIDLIQGSSNSNSAANSNTATNSASNR
jgi:cytochrome c-type biogenesis protein CcmH/NrfG